MNDILNGLFEIGGAFLLTMHCRNLYRDKTVRGMSVAPFIFFTAWGYWNLYYYPSVGCPWSFAGGVAVVLVNTVYLAMLWWYLRKPLNSSSVPTTRMIPMLRIYHDDGSLATEAEWSDADLCSGYRTGEMGGYCGGCCGCMSMQADHAGMKNGIEWVVTAQGPTR